MPKTFPDFQVIDAFYKCKNSCDGRPLDEGTVADFFFKINRTIQLSLQT